MCHFGTHSGRIREDPGGQHHSTKLPREWEVWRHWQKWAESVTPGVFHFSPNKIWLDAIIALKIWALILSDTGGDQLKHSTCSFETFLVILVLVFCVICKSRQYKRICNYIKCKCDNLLEKCTANTENTSKYGTLKFTQYNRRLKTEKHLVNVGVVPEYPDIKTLLAHSPTSLTSGQHMLLVKSNFFLNADMLCMTYCLCFLYLLYGICPIGKCAFSTRKVFTPILLLPCRSMQELCLVRVKNIKTPLYTRCFLISD